MQTDIPGLRAEVARMAAEAPGPWRLLVFPASELTSIIDAGDAGDAEAAAIGRLFGTVSENIRAAPQDKPCTCLTCAVPFPRGSLDMLDWPATVSLLGADGQSSGIALLSCWWCYQQRTEKQFLVSLRRAVRKLTTIDARPEIVAKWRVRSKARLEDEAPAGHA